MKKKIIKNSIIWAFMGVYLIAALSFTSTKQRKNIWTGIEMIVNDTIEYTLIDRNDIIELIENKYGRLLGSPIDSFNMAKLEELVSQHPAVKHSELYQTIDGTLYVEIEQRNPILRIVDRTMRSYYVDNEGYIIPVSDKYSAHVVVANGHIPPQKPGAVSIKNRSDIRHDIFHLTRFIDSHPFWRAQIEQIYVTAKNEFELVPRVGMHIIEFGTIENYQEKFKRLKHLYTSGLKHTGWEKYKTVNVKYKNQIVCTKRE